MKRILIVSHTMEIGGAERALLGLLENLNPQRVSVDLFLLRHEGELIGMIPKYIHLLPPVPAYTVLGRPIIQTIKEGHILLAVARLLGKAMAKWYDRQHRLTESAVAIEYSHKYTKCLMPLIQPEVEYDLAISFLTPHYFVAEKVRAKKKIAWIHTDYSVVQVNQASELMMWKQFDHIASISANVTEAFLSAFPTLKDKIILIENILPKSLIVKQATELPDTKLPEDNCVKLLSIGRFTAAKNFDNIPDICSRILAAGCQIKWYLIGYGGEEALIRRKITEARMQEYVIILGKKKNPYPYIKACDLYVQPSRYEGKCVSVIEAQILHKPVVITNYATAGSQLENGVDGVIVPMELQSCAMGIVEVLRDKALQKRLIEKTKQKDYTNANEVKKIYHIMES